MKVWQGNLFSPPTSSSGNNSPFDLFPLELGKTGIADEQFQRCFDLVDKAGTGIISKHNFVQFVPQLYELDFDPPVVVKSEKPGKKQQADPAIDPKDPSTFFVKVKKIGKGSYGQVFKAIDVRTQQVRPPSPLYLSPNPTHGLPTISLLPFVWLDNCSQGC